MSTLARMGARQRDDPAATPFTMRGVAARPHSDIRHHRGAPARAREAVPGFAKHDSPPDIFFSRRVDVFMRERSLFGAALIRGGTV